MDNLGIPATNDRLLVNSLVPIGSDSLIPNSFNSNGTKLDPTITLPLFAPPTFSELPLKIGGISNDSLFQGISNTSLLRSAGSSSDLFPTAPIPEGLGITDLVMPIRNRYADVATLESPDRLIAMTIDRAATGDLASITATNSQTLTPEILAQLKSAAIERWAALGLSPAEIEKLQGTKLVVDDLTSNTLAETQGYTIVLDWDASGIGWYVDATPLDNSEFSQQVSATELVANGDSIAFRKVDLLSAIEHEYGHILGLEHSQTDRLMSSTIPIGERLLPSLETLQGLRQDGIVSDRVEVAGADLALTLAAPTTVFKNTSIPISWTITNQGNAATQDNLGHQILFYLSEDNILDDSDSFVSYQIYTTIYAPGQSQTDSIDLTISSNFQSGQYYLISIVDRYNEQPDLDRTNNIKVTPLEIQPAQIDLSLSDLIVSSPIVMGQTTNISWNISNQGISSILSNYSDSYIETFFYLSDDTVLDTSDLLVSTSVLNGINAATTLAQTVNPIVYTLDNVNGGGSNGGNGGGFSGAAIQFGISAANSLAQSINQSIYTLDATNGSGAIGGNIISQNLSSVVYNSNSTIYGNKYLIATTHVISNTGEAIDTNLTNNTIYVPVEVRGADLVITELSSSTNSVKPGGDLTVTWTVENQGNDLANAINTYAGDGIYYVNDSLYLSKDTVINSNYYSSDNDLLLNSTTTGDKLPLAPGDSYTITKTFKIPTSAVPGQYYLILQADGQVNVEVIYAGVIPELSESNNTQFITFIVAPSNWDLAIGNIQAPQIVDSGQSIAVSWDVTNQGTQSLPTTIVSPYGEYPSSNHDRVYLSTDNILDSTDRILNDRYTTNISGLAANSSYSGSATINLSGQTPGDYYLIFETDSDKNWAEDNETNNTTFTQLHIKGPDLIINSASAPDKVALNQTIPISWVVSNIGESQVNVPNYDAVYLSDDNILDSSDLLIAPLYAYKSLQVDGQSTFNGSITIPNTTSGNKYLIFKTNSGAYYGSIPETNSNNNTFARSIEIVIPDLKLTEATAPATAVAGDTIRVDWKVDNPTDVPALLGKWYDRVYLSKDNVFGNSDDLDVTDYLYTYNGKPVAPNSSSLNFANITLPVEIYGNYYLFVKTDTLGNLTETNENNNVSTPISISIFVPNLTVAVTSPPTATVGQKLSVSWQVNNVSTTTTVGTWTDRVYLSDDPILSTYNDRLLTSEIHSTRLAGGANYTVNKDIQIDSNIIGQKYLIFQTNKASASSYNSNSNQTESDYTDNTVVRSVYFNAPDLKAESITAIQTAAEFDTAIDVNWIVSNLGEGKAIGNWEDRIYLSKDRVLSDDDLKLGSQLQNITNLDPNDRYQGSSSVFLTYNQPLPVDANGYISEIENNDTINTANDLRLNFLETGTNKYKVKVQGNSYNYEPDYYRFDASPGDTVNLQIATNNYYPGLVLYDRNGTVLASGSNYYGSASTLYTFSSSNYLGEYYVRPSTYSYPYYGYYYNTSYQLDVELQTSKLIQPQPPEAGEYYLILKADAKDGLLEGNDLNSNTVASVTPITITYANRRPDLTIAGTVSQANLASGATIPIGWTVTNQSTVNQAIGNWNDYVYLSDDNILDASDTFLSSQSHSSLGNPLAAGGSYHVDSSVKLPNNITGNKFLLFVTDRNNNSLETDETNNVSAVAISIGIPDLKIQTTTTPPTTVSIDRPMTFSWTVTNISSSSANGQWKDRVYLSNDNVLDAGDTYLAELASPYTSLSPNAQYQQNYNLAFSDLNSIGTKKYLIVVTNSDGQLLESDRTNNTLTLPIDITAPNLKLTGIDAPNIIGSNRNITVTLTGINNGTAAIDIGGWLDGLYLSRDRFLDSDDLQLNSGYKYLTEPLKVGDSYSQVFAATIPDNLVPGDYYLIGATDVGNARRESNETDNSIIKQIQIGVKSDLVVSAVNTQSVALPGGQLSIDWTVRNQGTADALTSWTDSIYLSDNDRFDSSDLLLATKANANTLAINTSYTSIQSITLPIQSVGSKYLIVRTNSTSSQSESDSLNNYFFVPINIQAPDLTISNLTAPNLAQLGDKVTVTWKVNNNSLLNAISGWNDGIYISKDNILYSSDTLLSTVSKTSLTAGGNYAGTADITIPDFAPGNYYLIAKTDKDSQQLETDETNNTTFSSIQLVYPPASDLVVDTINPPTTGTSGDILALTWQVSNQGQLATNSTTWTDRVYISTKNTFDNTAIAIGTADRTGKLSAGENYLQTATFTLPNAISGNYYFFVTTDANNQVNEYKFENNNTTNSSGSVAVTRKPDPDLVVTNLTYASTGQPGQKVLVNWTVNNTGLGIAKGNWIDRVYLTNASGTIDISLQTKAAPTNLLDLGGSYTNSAEIALPTNLADGNYQIAVVTNADNSVFEGAGTGNNKYTQGQITSGHPDLAVTVNPSPLSATSGTTIPINWTVQNVGTAATLVNWQDRVYLSNTATFDGNARLVGTFDRNSSLAVNGSYNGLLDLTLPIDTSGRQYLFVQTDAGRVLPELGSTANNLTSIPIDITLAPYADLVVSNVTAPELLVRDPAQLDVSWKVSNQGTGAGITNNWIDRVILVGEGREITVGEFSHTGSLAVGSDYTRTESISLPGALLGKFQLFVRTDATNLVFENGSESNNATAAPKLLTVIPKPYADLVVSNFQLNGTAKSGQNINLSWQVSKWAELNVR